MGVITRRGFIATTATMAAASTARAASGNDKIRIAVIGCRNRGPTVALNMLATDLFEIVTLCDCDDAMLDKGMQRLEGKTEKPPKREKDFRRVLEDKNVDAVINATPDHWHALITCLALEAGKHVYLEKPASYNIADGKAMVAAQERHPDLVIQVGMQQRSGAHFAEAKAFIDGGGLGKVGFCRACAIEEKHVVPKVANCDPPAGFDYEMWLGPAPHRPYNPELTHYNWHYMYDNGTGRMGNWGAHWVDVALWFMNLGFPNAVSGMGGQFVVKDAKQWPDTQIVTYQYPECTVVWEGRMWSRFGVGGGLGNGCEFDGEKGSMLISRAGWTFYPRDSKKEKESHKGTDLDREHARNFAACIRGDAKPNSPIEEGHKTAALCHLGNISTRLNRALRFDPEKQTIVGDPEAQAFESREYRDPWKLPG